jgi:hypothetical protein
LVYGVNLKMWDTPELCMPWGGALYPVPPWPNLFKISGKSGLASP